MLDRIPHGIRNLQNKNQKTCLIFCNEHIFSYYPFQKWQFHAFAFNIAFFRSFALAVVIVVVLLLGVRHQQNVTRLRKNSPSCLADFKAVLHRLIYSYCMQNSCSDISSVRRACTSLTGLWWWRRCLCVCVCDGRGIKENWPHLPPVTFSTTIPYMNGMIFNDFRLAKYFTN